MRELGERQILSGRHKEAGLENVLFKFTRKEIKAMVSLSCHNLSLSSSYIHDALKLD